MGAGAPVGVKEKVNEIMKAEDPSEEDIRAVISELPSAIHDKLRRVLDDMQDNQYFYDVARMRGSLCESILKEMIETGAVPAERAAIEEDMRQTREAWKRPVNLPAIQGVHNDDGPGQAVYHLPAEAYPDYTKVPRGSIIHIKDFQGAGAASVFPGIKRDLKIYLPDQLTPDMEPALILCNDGDAYFEDCNGCQVLDSLIHAGSIPVTVGVFIDAGVPLDFPSDGDEVDKLDEKETNRVQFMGEYQRKVHYDSPTDKFPRFARDELLPFVLEQANLKSFSPDPGQRCAVGVSSSGMQAFNLAWQHPHLWGRVLSHSGAFVGLNGGHNYPIIVRRSDRTGRKNLRIVLVSGSNDNLDDVYGSFALGNHNMADALRFAGYDYRYDFGIAGHGVTHGRAMFAEHLRWLFRKT